MRVATRDRGQILDVAGAGHLSPAVRDGVPVFAPEGENAGRTGWAGFFAALDARGLVIAWEADDPSSAAPVPAAEGAPLERHPGLAAGIDRARRFLAAFRGGAPTPPAS